MVSWRFAAIFPSGRPWIYLQPGCILISRYTMGFIINWRENRRGKSITDCLFGWNWRKTLRSSLAEPSAIHVEPGLFHVGIPLSKLSRQKFARPKGVAGEGRRVEWTAAKKPLLRFGVFGVSVNTNSAPFRTDPFVPIHARLCVRFYSRVVRHFEECLLTSCTRTFRLDWKVHWILDTWNFRCNALVERGMVFHARRQLFNSNGFLLSEWEWRGIVGPCIL